MPIIPTFTNAPLESPVETALQLCDIEGSESPRTERDVRRSIERMQTKIFVHEAMREARVSSVYALEALMVNGVPGTVFPYRRPKLCDRMASRGEPAVAKQLRLPPKNNDRTNHWFKRITDIAPHATETISLPIWRAIDPRPLPHVEWHSLAATMVLKFGESGRAQSQQFATQNAWRVNVTASAREDPQEYYFPYIGPNPDLLKMTSLVIQIRRWEALGDLVAYDLALQQALRAARIPAASPDLASIQPGIADHIAKYFGAVLVPFPELNLEYQRERIATGRAAWETRVLVGPVSGMQGLSPE